MTSRIPMASRIPAVRGTSEFEAFMEREVPQANQRAPAPPQTGESSRLGSLASLADNRRRPHDSHSDTESSSARRVRQRISLPMPAGAADIPAAWIADMPKDLLEKIARPLCSTDKFQWFTNLHSLSGISAGFREAIRGDDLLRYDEIRRKVVEANALVNRMSDEVMVHWQVMPSLVKMMALLS